MIARAVLVTSLLALDPVVAAARDCRVLEAEFLPAESANPDVGLRRPLQIVAWLEDANGATLLAAKREWLVIASGGTAGFGRPLFLLVRASR